MKTDYSKIEEAGVVVSYIKSRKRQGLYTLTLVAGLPGTGKSSTCLRMAERVSEELTGENQITSANIIDDLLGLIKFVMNADPEKVCIAVVEEISVLFPSRRAMAGDNLAVAKILDTARKKQIILFANAPIVKSIDSHLRALSHIYVETLRIMKTECVVICKALRMQTNPGSGKTYLHKFRRKGREVALVILRKPNQETWAEYEAKKDKFMAQLYEQLKFKTVQKQEKLLKEMGKKTGGVVVKQLSPREIQVYDMMFKNNMTNGEVSKKLGVHHTRVTRIKAAIIKKMNIIKKESPTCTPSDLTIPIIPPIT